MRTLRLITGVVCTTTMAFGGISELPNARADAYSGVMAATAAYDYLDDPYLFPNDCAYFVSRALWGGGLSLRLNGRTTQAIATCWR